MGPEFLEFFDVAGVCWRVTERDTRSDPGALRSQCLIFSCSETVRRVWDYPTEWRGLDSDALIALSWQR